MSVQFGRWNFRGIRPAPGFIERVQSLLAQHATDSEGSYRDAGVDLLYSAFHTTEESINEVQPHVLQSGVAITWDGRLDNREDLLREISNGLSTLEPDVSIVAAAYDKWETGCFRKLTGDWALCIWNPRSQTLVLARDFLGTRHLFFQLDANEVSWSTLLDPLVLFAGKEFALEEEYVAGWLASFPAAHLTPYVGISAVPAGCFVSVVPGSYKISRYWSFDGGKTIRYRTDAEYEEHFRSLFAQSIRRRLRSSSPILAELSGGMDSSSIVCMADRVASEASTPAPRIDTVSHFSDEEPHWDERPFFGAVEKWRGRKGLHINAGLQQSSSFEIDTNEPPIWPHSAFRPAPSIAEKLVWMSSHGYRVVLSGLGGDETMGGIPNPIPELQDLFVTGEFSALARQLRTWALQQRRPWFHLLHDVIHGFLPTSPHWLPACRRPAEWVHPAFVSRHRQAFSSCEGRLTFFGALPSFQENTWALESLRRQLACELPGKVRYEKRYPFLDADLLQFIFAIPREQLLRPGERRSLMRRALVGIVPPEILNRKRKAYVTRYPILAVAREHRRLGSTNQPWVSSSLAFVIPELVAGAVEKAQRGQAVLVLQLLRTLGIELWLRRLQTQGIFVPSGEEFRCSFIGKYDLPVISQVSASLGSR